MPYEDTDVQSEWKKAPAHSFHSRSLRNARLRSTIRSKRCSTDGCTSFRFKTSSRSSVLERGNKLNASSMARCRRQCFEKSQGPPTATPSYVAISHFYPQFFVEKKRDETISSRNISFRKRIKIYSHVKDILPEHGFIFSLISTNSYSPNLSQLQLLC